MSSVSTPASWVTWAMTSLMVLTTILWSLSSPSFVRAKEIRVTSSSPYVIWRFISEARAKRFPVLRSTRNPTTVVVPMSTARP